MPAEIVDALELSIKTRAEDAAQQIENLATSVGNFGKNVRRYINNLNDFSAALTSIAEAASKLSNTKGLAKVLNKVAPVAAAMKAKMPAAVTKSVDWRRQMFPNEKEYNAIFQPRGYNKGKAPGKVIRVGNNSAYVMDPEDVSKSGARGLSKQIYKNYGLLRGSIPMSDMDARIAKIRSGYGRTIGANNAWMTENAFKEMQELAKDILRASEPNHENDVISHIKALGGVLRFDKDTDMTDQKIGDLNREFSGLGIKFSKTSGMSVEDIRGLRNIEDLFGGINPAASAARSIGLNDGDTLNDLIGMMRDARGRKEYNLDSIIKDLMSNIADINVKNEREMADEGAMAAQAAMKEAFKTSQKAAEPEVKQEAERAATEIKETVKEAVKTEADTAKSAFKGKSNEPEYAAIREAARIADEQEARSRLEFALSDNTPGLIAASRSRFASAGLLDSWNEIFGKNIPGLADKGLAAGLIDADTAQAMKDAAEGVEHIAKAAEDASGKMDELANSTSDVAGEIKDATKESKSLKDVLKAAGSSIGNSFIGKLGGQLFRIAKMRGLRYIVRELAAGLKEGIDNLYQWSSGAGGHFAGAMDTIASKTMLAKNAIATAFAPAIEALVPVLSTVVGWINSAANAFAQLVSLLTGKNTWTKAVETAESWGDATNKAGSGAKTAAKEMKDLLADWDELNIIQSETGSGSSGSGGGSGKKATDYSKMFQEMTAFDEWTRYFDQIKNIVLAIGAGIAGWNLIGMASTFLEKIGVAETTVKNIASKLGKALSGMVLLTVSFELSDITGKSIARNGVNLTNALTGLGSIVSGALGGFFLASAINPSLGIIGAVAGLTMSLAVGIRAYVDEKRVMLYEDVDKYLEAAVMSKVFTFDVDAVVERVNTTVENVAAARRDVHDQLVSVLDTVEVLKLGVDEPNTWNELYKKVIGDGENSLIGKIQKELTEDKNVITLYYQTKSKAGLEGKTGSGTVAANGMRTELLANDWLAKKYEELGRDFADKFNQGEIAQIKEGAAGAAMAILETITGAKAAAEKAMNEAELEIDFINAKKGLDDEVVMDEMATLFEEYEQKLADSRKKAAEEHYTLLKKELAELEFLGADESMINDIRDQIDKARAELEADEFKINVHAEFIDDEKEMFGEELVKRYGPQLAQLVSALSGEHLGDLDFLNEVMNNGGYDSFVKMLMEDFMGQLPESAKKWLLDNNIDISDFFTEEQKSKVQAGKNRIEPDEIEEVVEDGLDGTADRINAEIDSILDTVRENAARSGVSIEDYIATMDKGELWPILDEITQVLDKSNLNSGEQSALDDFGGQTSDLIDDNLDNIYQLMKDRYGEEAKRNSWFNSEQGVTVDAATSGMALDSTMANVGNTIQANAATMEGLVTTVASRMLDVIASNDRAANRPINVNISPSTGFGRTMGFSNNMWGKIIG